MAFVFTFNDYFVFQHGWDRLKGFFRTSNAQMRVGNLALWTNANMFAFRALQGAMRFITVITGTDAFCESVRYQ